MVCYHPIKAYRPLSKIDGGRLVFDATKALNPDHPLHVPCNQCRGCRERRQRDWSIRIHHESKLYDLNSFVTLTFNQNDYPESGSIAKRDVQLFMKRLRKARGHDRIKYYACGEYGDGNGRAHYHAILLNCGFLDRKYHSTTPRGDKLYTSDDLSELWPCGHSWIGDVTLKSARYVAGYVNKKMVGDKATEYYLRRHPYSGSIVQVEPEFQLASQGLGRGWFNKYKSDYFPSDFVVVDDKMYSVPLAYMKWLKKEEPDVTIKTHNFSELRKLLSDLVSKARAIAGRAKKSDNTKDRLLIREECKRLRQSLLKREL